ncbi:Hypothetical protein SPCCCB_spr1742 [Streptococcus pneumoniae CCCB]|uniref:DUF4231 domain-containing protein n=1 Tax=Streptococcus pneumoniae (strain ATCC BAA-255 / R6) TaxID=171101 RepID=Q8CYB3_STRR6|nr:Hypothetical protein spr1742 [Streptococcus pneumoniae R6]OLV90986.1 Hypothetical protein SPCCCB_spr1742 [Streptococcus pneumoniae CCCB]
MKGVTNMTPEEMYLTERLDVQIAHFLKKSVQHRRRYKVLKITEIVAGFLIAVFCAIPMPGDRYRLISVALSSLGLLCEGIINLYNAKENWISYQKTAQLLEKKNSSINAKRRNMQERPRLLPYLSRHAKVLSQRRLTSGKVSSQKKWQLVQMLQLKKSRR